MRVGLNLGYLQERSGGAGRYARELIPALLAAAPELRLTLFVSADAPAWVFGSDWSRDVEIVRSRAHPARPGAVSMAGSLAAQWGALPLRALRRRLDVVHGLANVVPPLAPRVATVATILDLIWTRRPETLSRRGLLGMRLAAPVSARTADRVIAISAVGRDDIAATLGVDPARIDVTPLGVSPPPGLPAPPGLRDRHGLGDDPVVLCTAQLRRHKNVAGLIAAHARLRDRRARLVVVGPDGGEAAQLRELARRHGSAERVHVTGWVSDAELEGLYALASCFVLPSFEEGFGLPLLEAMARGVPVACSNTSALPEVAGDAALLFDPRDPAAITSAIDTLLADERRREELIARGFARCAELTWEATARATLASYERALGGPSSSRDPNSSRTSR